MKNNTGYGRTGWNAALVLAACFFLAGCSGKKDEQALAEGAAKTPPQKIQGTVDRLAQFPESDLRAKARTAVHEQRWVKPSGNSALEYYLALRQKLKTPDESVETAIIDIVPYAVIGMDQAIAKFDDREALRLEGLIRLADPKAPALARVKADLEKMKTRQAAAAAEEENKAAAAQALVDAAKAKDEAAKKAKAANAAQALAATQKPAAPVVQAPPAVIETLPEPVVQAPIVKAAIEPISTPQPPYPREALVSGTKGEIVAEITISGTGEVTGARIISASPRNVFDKTVQNTVRRWKYKGNGETTTIRRTFVFN